MFLNITFYLRRVFQKILYDTAVYFYICRVSVAFYVSKYSFSFATFHATKVANHWYTAAVTGWTSAAFSPFFLLLLCAPTAINYPSLIIAFHVDLSMASLSQLLDSILIASCGACIQQYTLLVAGLQFSFLVLDHQALAFPHLQSLLVQIWCIIIIAMSSSRVHKLTSLLRINQFQHYHVWKLWCCIVVCK